MSNPPKTNPAERRDSSRYAYNLEDICFRCGQEFGDHSAKAPHGSLNPAIPCGGFALKESVTKSKPKVKGLLCHLARVRNPWSAL